MLKRICVFCGSSPGHNPVYARAAHTMGTLLAQHGIELVYGGGHIGLMGIIADASLAMGGHVVGVIPQQLVDKELAHRGLTRLHVVQTMHERKALMAELSDAFIALPGGFGTWDEFCEILTWGQLGLHNKPSGLLNTNGYYDAFLGLTNRAVTDGFVRDAHRQRILTETDPARLLSRLISSTSATTIS